VVHEQAVSASDRTKRGAWYTPEGVVRGLVELATSGGATPDAVFDPACGGGAFLLAALDRLVELGLSPSDALARVRGLDIDPGAVAVSRLSLGLWAALHRVDMAHGQLEAQVTCGDALAGRRQGLGDQATLVIGNPPFGSPLKSGAVPATAEAFRAERGDLLGPYSDLAAIHLLAAVEGAGAGSTIAMVQPQSVLAGRDTEPLRRHLAAAAPLRALWACREAVFDAGVRACAVVVAPAATPSTVQLAAGPSVAPVAEVEADGLRWSTAAARALGAPPLPAWLSDGQAFGPGETGSAPAGSGPAGSGNAGSLGSIATATAGFRDEFYDLVSACDEWDGPVGDEPNRLLTVGSVEPLATKWGVDAVRFGGTKRLRPVIDCDRLSPKVGAWVDRQSQPKLVVATQSKILEPVVDPTGRLIPATPLLAVHADRQRLAAVAAVFLAPPVVAWAWQRWFGAALSVDALKLAARQVAELPLPSDQDRWDQAAELITVELDGETPEPTGLARGWALSLRVAELMNEAYGAEPFVYDWWLQRAGGPARHR
jgi:predicted RNA methylase